MAEKNYFVHESSYVDESAEVGKDTKIWHFGHISDAAKVGERCVFGQNVFVGKGVSVGNGVKVQNNVSIYSGVEVGDDVFLGPSCVFTNVQNPRAFVERKEEFLITKVGQGASIGANATIVCGNDVGDYAFVGAGSVVTHNVQPHALVYGAPARRHGWMCRCGEKLPVRERPECARCGDRYAVKGERCIRVESNSE